MVQQTSAKNTKQSNELLITNLHATISGLQQDRLELESEIAGIQSRLETRSFRWMESIALGPEPIMKGKDSLSRADFVRLKAIDIVKLASEDLQKMLIYLKRAKQHIDDQIHVLHMQIQETTNKIKAEEEAEQNAYLQQRDKAYLQRYQTNPGVYLAAIFSNFRPDVNQAKDELYSNADQILAVCDQFDAAVDSRNLWLAWEIVNRAAQFENNIHYVKGAKHLLNVFCANLPQGMQGLKFLYESKQFEKVNSYLRRAYLGNVTSSYDEYNDMLLQLARDVEAVSLFDAKVYLEHTANFKLITEKARSAIIEQQAFINRIEFDVNYLEPSHKKAEILALLKLLKNNIYNYLHPKIKYDLSQNIEGFKSLKEQVLDSTRGLVLTHPVNISQIRFGSGLGMSWQLPDASPRAHV